MVVEFSCKDTDSSKRFNVVVATTHLFWDPLQEDVKLLQTQRLFRHVDTYIASRDPLMPLIVTGDFNSLPDSAVYKRIVDDMGYKSAYANYSSDSTLRGEPEFTNVNGVTIKSGNKEVPSFIGTLDYIFYRSTRYLYYICFPVNLFDFYVV